MCCKYVINTWERNNRNQKECVLKYKHGKKKGKKKRNQKLQKNTHKKKKKQQNPQQKHQKEELIPTPAPSRRSLYFAARGDVVPCVEFSKPTEGKWWSRSKP